MKHKSVTMLGSRTDFKPLQTVLSDRELVFEATVAKSAVLKSFLEVLADQPSPWKLLTRALRMVALVTDMPKPRSLTRFSEKTIQFLLW